MEQLTEVFTCDCKRGFNWKTKQTYKNHLKSNRHQTFETKNQELDHRKSLIKLQIEYDKLERDHHFLKELFLKTIKENRID